MSRTAAERLLLRRARTCLVREDQAGALAAFTELLALRPDDASTWADVGSLLADAGLRAEADNHFEHALALDPRFADAWIGLGMGRSGAEALRCFDAAIAIDAEHHGAWFLKHVVLTDLGNAEEATRCLTRARMLSPGTYG
jgi:Flp pilus assembly protein TadD